MGRFETRDKLIKSGRLTGLGIRRPQQQPQHRVAPKHMTDQQLKARLSTNKLDARIKLMQRQNIPISNLVNVNSAAAASANGRPVDARDLLTQRRATSKQQATTSTNTTTSSNNKPAIIINKTIGQKPVVVDLSKTAGGGVKRLADHQVVSDAKGNTLITLRNTLATPTTTTTSDDSPAIAGLLVNRRVNSGDEESDIDSSSTSNRSGITIYNPIRIRIDNDKAIAKQKQTKSKSSSSSVSFVDKRKSAPAAVQVAESKSDDDTQMECDDDDDDDDDDEEVSNRATSTRLMSSVAKKVPDAPTPSHSYNSAKETSNSNSSKSLPANFLNSGYKLIVSNLHPRVTEDDVLELFSDIGPIKRAKFVDKGLAEVTYIKLEHAKEAIAKYDRNELDGRPMRIELADKNSRTTNSNSNSSSQPERSNRDNEYQSSFSSSSKHHSASSSSSSVPASQASMSPVKSSSQPTTLSNRFKAVNADRETTTFILPDNANSSSRRAATGDSRHKVSVDTSIIHQVLFQKKPAVNTTPVTFTVKL